MDWETPDFVEVKMDAEISAYQQDEAPGGPEPTRLPEPRAASTDE